MVSISTLLGLSPTNNYSVLALPLYYMLAIVPHGVAISTASGGNPLANWDNRNPRTDELRAALKARLPPAAFARYQRAEAAHYNSLESIPLFFAAVVLGNVARVPPAELNELVVRVALVRAAYIVSYLGIADRNASLIRSAVWFLQVGIVVRFLWKVGGLVF